MFMKQYHGVVDSRFQTRHAISQCCNKFTNECVMNRNRYPYNNHHNYNSLMCAHLAVCSHISLNVIP